MKPLQAQAPLAKEVPAEVQQINLDGRAAYHVKTQEKPQRADTASRIAVQGALLG